jgi:hypothetical protein
MDTLKYFFAGFVALFVGCSSDSHVAGNSAETGSPELAGILVLDGGKPAARTKVQCVPEDYDAMNGEALPAAYSTETDDKGYYRLDSVPNGTYAIEAYHEESGKRLLVQGVKVTEDDSVALNDTLRAPGVVKLELVDSYNEHKVVAIVPGTTIRRETSIRNFHELVVDSLPTGELDLQIYFDGDYWTSVFEVEVVPGDTQAILIPSAIEPDIEIPHDSVSLTFVAPLALPEGADTLTSFVSDIPIAIRLTEDYFPFDSVTWMTGRWEAVRISKEGNRSKKLPVSVSAYDHLTKMGVLWVNVDSLNVGDSLEFSYDGLLEPAYARDMFPTNRSYSLVWHFGNPLSPMADYSEYGYFDGRLEGPIGLDAMVDGVLGGGVQLDTTGYFYVKNSAVRDSTHQISLNFDGSGYFCFSVWVKLDNLDKEQTIFKKPMEYGLRYVPEKGFVVDLWVPDSSADSVKYAWASGTSDIKAGEWVYVAFSRHTNSSVLFYVDDRKIETEPETIAWTGVRDLDDFIVGGFTGTIDELMLGGCFRDDSWTHLTYLNQRPENYWPALSAR